MTRENTGIPKIRFTKLERSLNELTAVVAEHAKYLDKHIRAMENLTQTLKQLDTTIKKEISLGSSNPSIELKEAITSFLDYHINPRYYRDTGYLKLTAASETKYPEPVKRTKHQKQH